MAVRDAVRANDVSTTTLRKIRNHLLPLLFLLYIVAFLDRGNVAFAALTMNAELGLTPVQFGLLAGIFFWGYFLFEIPSNLLLHKIGARIWIARILVTWGVVATLTGLVHSAAQLYSARFLLGVAEAGCFPGIALYLTYWFPQREQARVLSLFLVALPVSSILGAPVSGFILDHVHWFGISSWRWLLILEGLPAIACGALTYLLLPNRPSEAKFLTPVEQDWITSELAREEQEKTGGHSMSAWRALAHPRVWQMAAAHLGSNLAFYGMSFYMPQAIKSLSSVYSNTTVGILVMVPYLAGLVAMILVARSSDARLERRYHAAVPAIIAGIALMSLGASNSPMLSIILWSFTAIGICSYWGPFWSMPSQFLAGYSAASGIALINSIAALGGFIGPSVVGAVATGTRGIYGGLALGGVCLMASAALILLLPIAVVRANHPSRGWNRLAQSNRRS